MKRERGGSGDEAALGSGDERLVELATALERHFPAVSSAPNRYGVRVSVEASSASRAVALATRYLRTGARRVERWARRRGLGSTDRESSPGPPTRKG